MRQLSIILAAVLGTLIAVDLRIAFTTGIVRDMWGNVVSAADQPRRYWRHVYTSCVLMMLCGGFILWELGLALTESSNP
jgi:hypothetical protein